MGKARRNRSTVRCRKGSADGPVFLWLENLDLGFALTDQAQRDRLYATRRLRSRQFAPQDRRQAEPDQIVERTTCKIGVNQFLVEPPWIVDRLDNCVLGDFMKNDALDVDVVQRVTLVQDFLKVPGNRFAFAIRIGRKIQVVGALDGVLDGLKVLFRFGIHRPDHMEVFVRLNGPVFGDEIAHVTDAGEDFEVCAKILVDGLRLGRRLDDDYVHDHR